MRVAVAGDNLIAPIVEPAFVGLTTSGHILLSHKVLRRVQRISVVAVELAVKTASFCFHRLKLRLND